MPTGRSRGRQRSSHRGAIFSFLCAASMMGGGVGGGMWVKECLLVSRLRLEDGVRACFPAALGEAMRLTHAVPASYLSFHL